MREEIGGKESEVGEGGGGRGWARYEKSFGTKARVGKASGHSVSCGTCEEQQLGTSRVGLRQAGISGTSSTL